VSLILVLHNPHLLNFDKVVNAGDKHLFNLSK
jgi:hypothetical protein